MAEYIAEKRFAKASEFLDALTPWGSEFEIDEYIYRGHSNSKYLLCPTSIRIESKEKIWECSRAYATVAGSTVDNDFSLAFVEYQLIRDFYKLADARGLHVPTSDRLRRMLHQAVDFRSMSEWVDGDKWLPEDMLEVAALAQHYGIATRLLDWTYDPFVAAFFSSKPPAKVDQDICIWALNISFVGRLDSLLSDFPLRLVTPHYSGNPNLAAQSGLFTHWAHSVPGFFKIAAGKTEPLPTVDRSPLDFQLKKYLSKLEIHEESTVFKKMVLPGSESAELARLLRGLGYGPAKLFPGYEGVAMEMRERPFLKPVR